MDTFGRRVWFLVATLGTSCALTSVIYPRSFGGRRVQVGSSDGPPTRGTLLECAHRCLGRQCVGFNFERLGSSSADGACDVRVGDDNVLLPSSASYDGATDFYGGFQDPIGKYDEHCGPLDDDLTFNCSLVSYVPGACNGTVICDVRSNSFERTFIVYGDKKANSILAGTSCCVKGDGERLAQVDNAAIQAWFCHVLHAMCGASKEHAFTFGMYRYTVIGSDPWRYLCDNTPQLPSGFYTNWYEPDRGKDRCVQMFSGEPHHFKWVQSTCDARNSNGRSYHCVCERQID